jgi:hypothetical protein
MDTSPVTPMNYRKLRIAWSVGWGLVAALLIVLWVRSCIVCDEITIGGLKNLIFGADHGSITVVRVDTNSLIGTTWEHSTRYPTIMPLGFQWFSTGRTTNLFIPIWYAVVTSITLFAIPWLRWRFSLRTLLVATTLVALVLGLIVWLR